MSNRPVFYVRFILYSLQLSNKFCLRIVFFNITGVLL